MQQAELVDLNDPEHQPEQTSSTSERTDAIQLPAFGFCAVSGRKQEHPQATQSGHRRRQQKARAPALSLHYESRAKRPERRAEPGQPEKKPNNSRLFCLAEGACD